MLPLLTELPDRPTSSLSLTPPTRGNWANYAIIRGTDARRNVLRRLERRGSCCFTRAVFSVSRVTSVNQSRTGVVKYWFSCPLILHPLAVFPPSSSDHSRTLPAQALTHHVPTRPCYACPLSAHAPAPPRPPVMSASTHLLFLRSARPRPPLPPPQFSRRSMQTACELLGVSASASKEEIERAFKIKARVTHPDRSDDPDATQRMQDLNEAKETLLNEAEPTQQIPWCDLVLPTMTFSDYNELRTLAEQHEIWRLVLEQWRTYFPQWIAAWEPPQALLQTLPTKPPVLEQVEGTQDPALVANADELPFPNPLQQNTRGPPAWTPQGQAAAAGASEAADESAAEVGPTRKRGAEKEAESEAPSKKAKHAAAHAQKKAAAQKTTQTEDGGYSLLPRGKHYAEGGVMTTGDERTCLPDAMTVILCMLFQIPQSSVQTISKKTIAWFADRVRSDPKRKEGCDPNAFDAMAFGVANKFSLTYVPNTSPRVLLNFATGLFLVRLLIHYVHEGNNKIDTHFLVYDATNSKIIDNLRGKGAVVVDAPDRKDNWSAIRPFRKELFPEAKKVIVDAVYSASL